MAHDDDCPHTEKMNRICGKIDNIKLTINGPPAEPEKGLVMKVDRLDQLAKQIRWLVGTGAAAAIGIFVLQLASMLGFGQ